MGFCFQKCSRKTRKSKSKIQRRRESPHAAPQEPDEDPELDQPGEGAGLGGPGPGAGDQGRHEGLRLDLRLPGQIHPDGGQSDAGQLLRLVTSFLS